MKKITDQNIDVYYNLILGLLSLYKNNVIITKNNYNEKDDIRELLVVNKKYLDIIENNNSN